MKHPLLDRNLLFGDFIVDRSGPKFAGYLADGECMELFSYQQIPVNYLIKLQKDKVLSFCEKNNLPYLSEVIDQVFRTVV